ncbi:hypothetical protein B9Z65_900 [Elsinoe australis]|uniref:Uncharacterized protein n=1 Tax=Elsinoe australis TaxID=40998 RepID=A0A2P8AJU9_9PEZI|nr:hypothetical protein B9Z65_900 [Elsinoe australis]
MKLSTYYEMDNSGHPTAMHDQAIPLDLSLGDIGCPLCKEIPLSSSRYAVPARIALLITSTRRVADAAQCRHTNLLNTLSSLAITLHSTSPYITFFKSDFFIVKPTKDILDLLCRTFDTTRSRYEPLYQLHNHITTVLDTLDAPFWQIQQLLITSNTDRGLARFEIDPLRNYHARSRTRLLCLQLRTVLAILSDYLNIATRTPALSARDRTFDSRLARQECNEIMDNAAKAGDYAHEVEGNLLWICFAVLQLSHCMATREDGKRYDELRREAKVGLLRVQKIMRARGKETEEMLGMVRVVEQLVGYVERGEGVGVDLTRVLVPGFGMGAMGGSQSQTGAVDVGRSHGVGTAKGKENVALTGQGVEELKERIRRLMM